MHAGDSSPPHTVQSVILIAHDLILIETHPCCKEQNGLGKSGPILLLFLVPTSGEEEVSMPVRSSESDEGLSPGQRDHIPRLP